MSVRSSRLQPLACLLLLVACDDDASSGNARPVTTTGTPDTLVAASDTTIVHTDDTAADDTAAPDDDTAAPDDDTAAPDDDTAADTTPSGPVVRIVVEGSDAAPPPADGLGAQTPDPYVYGLQRLELLRDAADPAPVVVFDHAPGFVAVDMHARTTVAEVPLSALPNGRFTHFRITLTHLDMDVAVTLHGVPVLGDLATPVRIVYALAAVTLDGAARAPGDLTVTGDVFGTAFRFPSHVDPIYPLPAPGASAALVDGATRVTFTLAEPLATSPDVDHDVTHVCTFEVAGSFRWTDTTAPGHAPDVWDVDLAGGAPAAEPVVLLGATGFSTRLEHRASAPASSR